LTRDRKADGARVAPAELGRFVREAARAAGADEPSAEAVTQALAGASLRGVDSHGVRLLSHDLKGLKGGRIHGSPNMTFKRRAPGAGTLDAYDGLGHLAGYRAIGQGIELAEEAGIAAVAVGRSSHLGAAGAYSLEAAVRGYMAIAVCNADDIVLAFDGTNSDQLRRAGRWRAALPDRHGDQRNPLEPGAAVPRARPRSAAGGRSRRGRAGDHQRPGGGQPAAAGRRSLWLQGRGPGRVGRGVERGADRHGLQLRYA
jgi:hypothetical protein